MMPGIDNLTNSGSMDMGGGAAGDSTSGVHNRSGQNVGGINMGGGINPWMVGALILAALFVFWKLKK